MSDKTFGELVGESIGEASMAWSEIPKGVFDSGLSSRIVDRIIDAHEKELYWLKQMLDEKLSAYDAKLIIEQLVMMSRKGRDNV
jgi:hypothetical protein